MFVYKINSLHVTTELQLWTHEVKYEKKPLNLRVYTFDPENFDRKKIYAAILKHKIKKPALI